MPKITADFIFNGPDGFLENHVLELTDEGRVVSLSPLQADEEVKRYEGILLPGFVNAHCHLELSVMKKQVPEGTGMTGFIAELFAKRHGFTDREKMAAIDAEMLKAWKAGTVAIGDICNTLLSLPSKCKHPYLFTHSFIELLGLDMERAKLEMEKGWEFLVEFETEGLAASLTSHAPYSMSETLIRDIAEEKPVCMSIHVLESAEERELFETESGPFVDFYKAAKLPYHGFYTNNPLEYILEGMDTEQQVIFVHNTEMKHEDIHKIVEKYPNAWFCFCPRSNYYIHRKYPAIAEFMAHTDKICLGTDSLASNHDLDVFQEARCLADIFPDLELQDILSWLTIQGARALGQEGKLGSFEVDSSPGVNCLQNIDLKHMRLQQNSRTIKVY